MVERCPVCRSNETQYVGYDLKCLSCGTTSALHEKPWEQPTETTQAPQGDTGINTTETAGGLQ